MWELVWSYFIFDNLNVTGFVLIRFVLSGLYILLQRNLSPWNYFALILMI